MLEVMVDGAYQYDDDDDKGIMVLEVMVDGVPSTDPPSKAYRANLLHQLTRLTL